MLKQKVRSGALALFAALMTLLAVPIAWAGEWIGSWDPPYGAPFVNPNPLGWRGTATFITPLSPTCNTNGSACVPGSSVKEAQVTFFDVNTLADIGQINWNTVELSGVSLYSLLFSGDTAVQFDTSLFPAKQAVLNQNVVGSNYGNFDAADFALKFVIDYSFVDVNNVSALYSGPLLFYRQPAGCPSNDCDLGVNDLSDPSNRPVLRVRSSIPEPASLALMASALIAAGAFSRRRPGMRDRNAP